MQISHKITQKLINSKNVLITAHKNPDGDALGSMIALGLSLKALNIKITMYNESPIPAKYGFLPCIDSIKQHFCEKENYDTAVILDCSDLNRIGKAAQKIDKISSTINIDHHLLNTEFGDFKIINSKVSATAEIIYHVIKNMGVCFNKDIATSIYTGILTDTGSFRFSNTGISAFEICGEMMGFGAEPSKIAENIYGNYSLNRIKLIMKALESIEILNNGSLSIITLTREILIKTGARDEDIPGLINYALEINGVKVAVLIKQHMKDIVKNRGIDKFHVSLRSDGSVDVSSIASLYHGGGHYRAAGFDINAKLCDLRADLINKLGSY